MIQRIRVRLDGSTTSFSRLMLGQVCYALIALGFNLVSSILWFKFGIALTSTNPLIGAAFCTSLLLWSIALKTTPSIPYWRFVNAIFSILIILFGVLRHLDAPLDSVSKVVAITLNTAGSSLLLINSLLKTTVSTEPNSNKKLEL